MNVKLWWLYVPWVRKRRLRRFEAALERMAQVIHDASDEEIVRGVVAWYRKREAGR